MKAVQIGILAALVVCAALLIQVFRSQQSTPPAPAQAATQAPAPAAAPVEPSAPAEAQPAPALPEPVAPAPVARPSTKKPSPTRVAHVSRPATPESARPAAEAPPPSPSAAQAPAPAQTPPPSQPAAAAPVEALARTEPAPPPPRTPQTVTIPAGTVISVRLAETISTEKNQPGDTFSATLDQPLIIDGMAIAERGARLQGKIAEALQPGRVKGLSSLVVQLTRLHTSDGQDITIRTEPFKKEGESTRGDDAKKVGVGAAIGAAIGAIAGGGKGAAIGAGVGGAAGAGTVMATRGKHAELPVETRLRFRIQDAVTITEKLAR